MESVYNRSYYRGIKRILKLMGIWPFQSSIKKKILRWMVAIIIGSIYLPKIIKLFESFDDLDVVLECLPTLGFHTVAFVKFFNWAINENHLKQLLLAIVRDWRSLDSERDAELLTVYTEHGWKVNNLYATTLYAFLSLFLSSPVIPPLLDVINPLNESRPLIYLYQTEYFIDQEKYYIYLLLHAYMTVPVSMGSIIFFDNLFAIFISHTCGMLEILKSHLEDLRAEVLSETINPLQKIKTCAEMQTNIINFVKCLESSYTIALLLIVGVNTAIIAMTGMMVIVRLDHPNEALRFLSFNAGTIFHLFWSSWQGHILIVQSESVFTSTYQNEWYDLPPELQRMLLPLMMRSMRPYQITAGSVYIMSMESFGVAMKATMSFLTLLLSVQ